MAETGIESLDNPARRLTHRSRKSELVGPECSGRTDIALSFVAQLTQASKVCAWIDVSNNFDPVSAAAAGVDLARLLWVRCGVVQETAKKRPARSFVLPEQVPRPTSCQARATTAEVLSASPWRGKGVVRCCEWFAQPTILRAALCGAATQSAGGKNRASSQAMTPAVVASTTLLSNL